MPEQTFDVVAELQRQLDITIAARRRAEEAGETVPDSGMPGFETWKRRALAEAGETYTVIRGERVPLDAPDTFEAYKQRVLADLPPKKFITFND